MRKMNFHVYGVSVYTRSCTYRQLLISCAESQMWREHCSFNDYTKKWVVVEFNFASWMCSTTKMIA